MAYIRHHCQLILIAVLLPASTLAVTVDISLISEAYCVYPTGGLCAEASGGVGPYSLIWNTGSTSSCINSLPPGEYSVTVTDFTGEMATAYYTLISSPMPGTLGEWVPGCPLGTPFGGPPYRFFIPTGEYSTGVPPFDVSGENAVFLEADPSGGFLHLSDFGPSGSEATYFITDGNGCSSTVTTSIPEPPQWLEPQVLDVNGACSGGNNGRIRVYVPRETSGWASAFRLHNGINYVPWTNIPQNDPNAFQAGYANRELIAQGLPAGTYTLVQYVSWEHYTNPFLEQWFSSEDLQAECPDTLATIVVPDLGYTCGTLSGRVYVDGNQNCLRGFNEPYLPNTVVEVLPGPYYAFTSGQGEYTINLPFGTYTVADQNPLFQEHCGVAGTPFTMDLGETAVVRDLADTSLVGLDMRLNCGSTPARPGFEVTYWLGAENLTGASSGTGTIVFTFDPLLQLVSTSIAPVSVTGNTIIWNMANLNAFQSRGYSARFQVPPDIGLLGTVLDATASLSTVIADSDLTNNSLDHEVAITGAYDPNDKLARTSTGNTSVWQIDEDEWIDYTLRFQNTGTDTAFLVVITDTLPPNLDPATFQRGVGSHSHYVSIEGAGILRWMFPNIQLPDSNVNEALSHGFVSFRIRPHLPLLPGDEITNIANIYFDFNPPVITEPSVLVVTTGTGLVEQGYRSALLVAPNPTGGMLTVRASEEDFRPGTLRIRAMDGRLVKELAMPGPLLHLHVEDLANGSYFVEFITGNALRSRTRFMKQ